MSASSSWTPAVRLPTVAESIAASIVLRVAFALGLGFGVDEAYAVTVARPISLSYFDHPPLHFWLAGLMTWASGTTMPVVVRLPFLALFTATLWFMAATTRRLFGEQAARIATLALASSGVLGITSGTWVLPDGPLLCGAAMAMWALTPLLGVPASAAHATDTDWWRWPVAGLGLAMALLAKYHGALFAVSLALFIVVHRDTRAQLRTRGPWLALVCVALATLPTLLWNRAHGWASFAFQAGRARPARWSLAPFAESVAGQLGWLLPWVAVPLVAALWWGAQRAGTDRRVRWCLTWAAAPIALFTLVTLGGARGLPHWQAPGWLFVLPLLGAWCVASGERGARWVRPWLVAAPAASLLLTVTVVAHAQWRVLDPLLVASARHSDPTRDAVSWRAATSARTTDTVTGTPDVWLVRSWIQGGQLGVALGATPQSIVCLCADPHHFAFRDTRDTARPWKPAATASWQRGILVERLQPWRRGWVAAPEALAGDSLHVAVRDTVVADAGVILVRYTVSRRAPPPSSAVAGERRPH